MTKKKTPNQPSSFDDLHLDKESFNELFSGEDSKEKQLQYLENVLKTALNTLAENVTKSFPDQSQQSQTPTANPNLSHFKKEFPAKKTPPASEPAQSLSDPPEKSSQESSVNTLHDALISEEPKPSFAAKNTSAKTPTTTPYTPKASPIPTKAPQSLEPTLLSRLLGLRQKIKAVFSNTKKPHDSKEPPSIKTTSHSMDDSLDRLKKREDKLKDLFDKRSGTMN